MTTIKVMAWNIGGGKGIATGEDVGKMASYSRDANAHIMAIIRTENPDIIMLQETHKNTDYDQVRQYCEELGYEHFIHDSTSRSHIDPRFSLGHAILSKHPIADHQFGLFNNPMLSVEWEDGSTAQTFDKGYSTVKVHLPEAVLLVTTTHLVPFRRFNLDIDSPEAKQILANVETSIPTTHLPHIIAGDFNIDQASLKRHLPNLLASMSEIEMHEPTTPTGSSYDHVLFHGMNLRTHRVVNEVVTDHYPVVAELTL